MAEPVAVAGLEEDLTCPICLGIYNNPVSLSCGHSFCQECIQEAWSCRQDPLSCPVCCAQADSAVELQPNVQLRSIAQKLLDAPAHQEKGKCEVQCEEKSERSGQQREVILCDFCLQEPQPAVKTCLSCEASLCQAHVSKHSTKGPSKDHVLIEVCGAEVLAERRCPQHNKLLECYCRTDSICICFLCCVTNAHKNHKIISLEEAFGQAQHVFPKALETVKTHGAALNESIANLLRQEEEVKAKESLQRNQLESLFEEMHLQLDNKKREILKALSQSKEQQISEIQAKIQTLKEEKDAADHDIQELEALTDQKDQVLFIKAFKAIQARKRKPVPKKHGIKLRTPPIILDGLATHTTLRLFQQFFSDMQSLFEAPPVHEHLTTSLNIGYPFNSTASATVISPSSCGIPSRPYVKSNQNFQAGCHFWEVDTSNSNLWKLGIIHSNFECYLEKTYASLSVFLNRRKISEKHFPTALKVVRLELDCERNTVSFYVSVEGGDPAKNLKFIETVRIPCSCPAYATFAVCEGSLRLL